MSDIVLDPEVDLLVDVHNTSADFARLPLLSYRYGLQYEAAKRTASMLEAEIKEVQGAEYLRIKSEGEKVTEAHMTALLQVSKKVKEAKTASFKAEEDAGTLLNILKSLDKKKDALVAISANNRSENK